ncbi:MAG: DUF3445 domain-containing protein [Hyphomicrobiales bacterium]
MTSHTPYDGSHKPFTIGLAPLDPAVWLEVDDKLAAYLTEKRRLYGSGPGDVMAAEAGTEEAQQEVLDLVVEQVLRHVPSRYARAGNCMVIDGGVFNVALDDKGLPPIARAALLVQEDFVLLRKSAEGWRIVAAALCFPSSWNLRDKFGKPLHEVHGPVPGFNAGTRNAGMLERMFDNLAADRPLLRWNWSLYGGSPLHHPAAGNGNKRRFGEGDDITGKVTLRLERQTLRKLPRSGDMLFTIRIHLDPLEVLERLPDGARLARAIDAQIAALTVDEVTYKGLAKERERLSARLQQIANGPLTGLRAEIDGLDSELISLLARRFQAVQRVAAVKATHNIPAALPERVEEVVTRVKAEAARLGFPPDTAERLWRQLIADMIAYEEQQLGG